jgi:hypothetical protein
MTVSIANMAQVWMSNTNTYNAIVMSVSTLGYGANINSSLLRLTLDGNTKFRIDANGSISANSIGTVTNSPFILSTNNTERMRIDTSGYVTKPYQPFFYSYLNRTTASGIANLTYGTVANGLSWSTDRVTVPVAGVYLITFMNIANDTSATRYDSQILVNGGVIAQALNDAATGYHQKSITVSYKCAASDYIQFSTGNWYATNSNPGQWNVGTITLLG